MLSDADIQNIVSRIVAGCRPIAVGLFGSYATGMAKARSDLDLLVIQRSTLPPAMRRAKVCRTLYGVLHPLDVAVFTPEEFEEGAFEEYSFIWMVIKQAKLLYTSDEAVHLVPSLFTDHLKS
jgi:predicted nucleotidyltransferase